MTLPRGVTRTNVGPFRIKGSLGSRRSGRPGTETPPPKDAVGFGSCSGTFSVRVAVTPSRDTSMTVAGIGALGAPVPLRHGTTAGASPQSGFALFNSRALVLP